MELRKRGSENNFKKKVGFVVTFNQISNYLSYDKMQSRKCTSIPFLQTWYSFLLQTKFTGKIMIFTDSFFQLWLQWRNSTNFLFNRTFGSVQIWICSIDSKTKRRLKKISENYKDLQIVLKWMNERKKWMN